MFRDHRIVLAAILSLSGMGSLAAAEEMTTTTSSVFSIETSIEQIADQLIGTWMTTEPIETQQSEDGNSVDVSMMMSIAPVTIEGMDNTMYVESSLSNATWAPFRQSIFQLYEYKGKVRLRTYTMALSTEEQGVLNGLTAAPSQFPAVSKDQLIATLDVELKAAGAGFSGSTPYPYPTGVMGAVEMTSSVAFDGKTLTVADRGYDAEGNIVWGADEDSSFVFEQVEPYAVATERERGLVVIDYPATFSDMVVQDGDEMHVHYWGYLPDGTVFDTSYKRGAPFVFMYPPGARAIDGWGMGMDGLSNGARRKLIIPSDIGYGPGGNPRASIPGDSTLYFNINLSHLDRPEPAPEAGSEATSESGEASSTDDAADADE